MAELRLEDWFPMSPLVGPPLPKWLGITWPWYRQEGPPPGRANLYGNVTGAVTSNPISGVLVTLYGMQVYTDTVGNYAFTDLEPGSYTITFGKEGYEPVVGDIILVEGTNDLNVEMVPIAAPPFSMNITGITTMVDKFATAFWLAEVTAVISNPHDVPITHLIRCIAAYGGYDPDDLASYTYTRYWRGVAGGDRTLNMEITLNPGESIEVVSPFYYLNGYNQNYGGYEWSNHPLGNYSGGVPLKYWFRIIDENNNWSPVASAGTYVR